MYIVDSSEFSFQSFDKGFDFACHALVSNVIFAFPSFGKSFDFALPLFSMYFEFCLAIL